MMNLCCRREKCVHGADRTPRCLAACHHHVLRKGDISNVVRMGTFLMSVDTPLSSDLDFSTVRDHNDAIRTCLGGHRPWTWVSYADASTRPRGQEIRARDKSYDRPETCPQRCNCGGTAKPFRSRSVRNWDVALGCNERRSRAGFAIEGTCWCARNHTENHLSKFVFHLHPDEHPELDGWKNLLQLKVNAMGI
jgi:hypothetical protein